MNNNEKQTFLKMLENISEADALELIEILQKIIEKKLGINL